MKVGKEAEETHFMSEILEFHLAPLLVSTYRFLRKEQSTSKYVDLADGKYKTKRSRIYNKFQPNLRILGTESRGK